MQIVPVGALPISIAVISKDTVLVLVHVHQLLATQATAVVAAILRSIAIPTHEDDDNKEDEEDKIEPIITAAALTEVGRDGVH